MRFGNAAQRLPRASDPLEIAPVGKVLRRCAEFRDCAGSCARV